MTENTVDIQDGSSSRLVSTNGGQYSHSTFADSLHSSHVYIYNHNTWGQLAARHNFRAIGNPRKLSKLKASFYTQRGGGKSSFSQDNDVHGDRTRNTAGGGLQKKEKKVNPLLTPCYDIKIALKLHISGRHEALFIPGFWHDGNSQYACSLQLRPDLKAHITKSPYDKGNTRIKPNKDRGFTSIFSGKIGCPKDCLNVFFVCLNVMQQGIVH